MTENAANFVEAFSSFIRASGRWRDTTPDALLGRWSRFVDDWEQGYPHNVEDYYNDLTSRDSLERALASVELQVFPEMFQLRASVNSIDLRFRVLLIPDIFPRIPEEFWWARGIITRGRRRFVEDVRREYQIDLIEIE